MSSPRPRALCAGPRTLFGLAGTVLLASALLAALVSPWFLVVVGFVAVNQLLYAAVGACPASLILRGMCSRQGGAR